MDLTITVTSKPNECKNPAHSKAMYEAPTTNIFPGAFFKEKISSEVITFFSQLGTLSKNVGLPPVAIKIYFDVIVTYFPSFLVKTTVLGPVIWPKAL